MARLILLALLALVANAQSTFLVTTSDATFTISEAKMLVRSSSGYIMGSEYQDFGGVYVTDPVVPPAGVELKKNLVAWKQLKRIEIAEWQSYKDGKTSPTKATLTMLDGKTRDVFVYYPSGSSSFVDLSPGNLRLTGRMKLGEGTQEVEVNPGTKLKSIEVVAGK